MGSIKKHHTEFIKNKNLILKPHQRYRSQKHNSFTQEINKTALSTSYDRGRKLINSIDRSMKQIRK